MTRPRLPAIRSLLLAVLLVPLAAVPGADASHQASGAEPPRSPPALPEDPPAETSIDPVDDALHDAGGAGRAANQASNATYQVLGATLNEARESTLEERGAKQPLTLLRDGGSFGPRDTAGPDGREGGFGDWKVLGHQAWGAGPTAAAQGQSGYTQATRPGDIYRGNAASLLVSPEIDLATNFGHDNAPTVTVYGALASACEVAVQAYFAAGTVTQLASVFALVYGLVPAEACSAYRALERQGHPYSFEYSRRYNLAVSQDGSKGRDGVTVLVFTQDPASVQNATGCSRVLPIHLGRSGTAGVNTGFPCTVVEPTRLPQNDGSSGGYPYLQVESMPSGAQGGRYPGYSGFSEWAREAIDLSPWEGRSVWVGFHFTSGPIPSDAYWENTMAFNTDAGFFGFHLDDIEVEAPAAPVNLKARMPSKPDLVPESLLLKGNQTPTLPPGSPVPAEAEVANLGTTAVKVNAVLRILDSDRNLISKAHVHWHNGTILSPAATLVLRHTFPALPEGEGYRAHVCTFRVEDGALGGDERFCDTPPLPGECSELQDDARDADRCDGAQELEFDVRQVVDLEVGDLRRDLDQVGLGDTLSMVLPLANLGNTPLEFTIQANVVDVSKGTPTLRGKDMLDAAAEGQTPRSVTMQPGERLSLNWTMKALAVGQFHLLLDMRDGGGDLGDFDPAYDLLPTVLQPWRASAIPGNVVADGSFAQNEDWSFYTMEQAIPGGNVRIGNTADRLHLGFRSPSPVAAVVFGDGNPDAQSGFILGTGSGMTGLTPLRFNAAALEWESDGSPPVGAEGARSQGTSKGLYTYELSVPLGVAPGGSGTSAGLGDNVSVLLRFCTGLGPRDTCQHFPFGAPLRDGDGIMLADGNLDDELVQWHKLRLSDGVPTQSVQISQRIVGPGFGVNSVRPAYLMADLAGCPSFHGWSTSKTRVDGVTDAWTCGAYPDDGRTLLYQGVTSDSDGCPSDCGAYAALNGVRTLTTPLFAIPADAEEPTLVLAHQYSTKVRVYDMNRTMGTSSAVQQLPHIVFQDSRLQAFVEVWNEAAGKFDAPVLLRPDGGYTAEADAGIADPRFTRAFMQEGESIAAALQPGQRESKGWWWPQGNQSMYQAPGQPLALGGEFIGGSPWTTDTIPLGGAMIGQPLDLRGKTVRLRFEHAVAPTESEVGDIRLDEPYQPTNNPPQSTFGVPVSLVNRSVLDEFKPMPLSETRPFTAVCRVGLVVILTGNPLGCNGQALATDIPLTPVQPHSGLGSNYNYGHPAGLMLGGGPSCTQQPCNPPKLAGSQLQSLPEGTAFDWVDDGDGVFGWGDALYLNVGGGALVDPRDVLIADAGFSTLPIGAPAVFCAATKCGPHAAVGHATDVVFHDQDGDGQWEPGNGVAVDRPYFPARVLNSGDAIAFDRSLDWGWRIGGLAVIEGSRFVRDVAVEDAVLAAHDPFGQGLGPGTEAQVRVTVRNLGSSDLGGVFVGVVGEVVGADANAPPLCNVQRAVGGVVVSGESRNVTLACPVPAAAAGKTLALRAKVWREGGGAPEDFLGNNQQRVRGLFPVKATPDAAIAAGVSPQDATDDTLRSLTLQVENRGNVPLRDVTVRATIAKVTDDGRRTASYDHAWTLTGDVGPGKSVTLSDRLAATPAIKRSDLRFDPPGPGRYVLAVKVSVPGDVDPTNDQADAPIRALSRLYQNSLDADGSGLVTTPGVMAGNLTFGGRPGVWSLQPNSHDGTTRLVAGDPKTGEIPLETDAFVRLPTVDLRNLRDATLSFEHRYDLEEGFDAARVEISADGGKTWIPAVPRALPAAGLPKGYSSSAIVGANAILGDAVEASGVAFTGRSEDLEGDRDGWISTEVDLTRQSAFFQPSVIDDLVLDGLADRPAKLPVNLGSVAAPQPQFTRLDPAGVQAGPPYWSLDEPGWFAGHRYWWVENRTYSAPLPPTPGKVWWSGSAGTAAPGEELPRVATRLELDLDRVGLAQDLQVGETAFLSWWEWRAGWTDGDRAGTGGLFHATLLDGSASAPDPAGDLDGDGVANGADPDMDGDRLANVAEVAHTRSDPAAAEAQVRIDERLASGWTRRSIPLSGVVAGDATGVAFTYLSGEADGIGAPLLTPIAAGPKELMLSYHQDNQGWFIGGARVLAERDGAVRTIKEYDLATLFPDAAGRAGDWTRLVANSFPGAPANAPIHWKLVVPNNPGDSNQGWPSRAGGWHLEEADVPGRGTTTAWRFSSGDPEGYPAGANSRVVTPLVDLRDQDGNVTLRFDHKYGFHGGRRAVDGGAVAYQVYDEATGGFGPWQPLGAKAPEPTGFVSGNLSFLAQRDSRKNWNLNVEGIPASFSDMGYSSMAVIPPGSLGGASSAFTTGFGQDLPASSGFIRTNFGAGSHNGYRFARDHGPWQPYPFAYAFSGDSEDLHPGTDGWESVDWDIGQLAGKKVRFGFQAWTNPSQEPCTSQTGSKASGFPPAFFGTPAGCKGPRHGWSVANVAVLGRTFHGGLADIRFRVATDGSASKGEWSLDGIQLSGTRFLDQVAPRIVPDTLQGTPGSAVMFDGEIANLGTAARPGLLLGISAVRTDKDTPVDVVLEGGPAPVLDRDGVPARVHAVYGPFVLPSGGTDGDRIPIRARLELPNAAGVQVKVRFEILEAKCTIVGGACVLSYAFARNEAGGAAAAAWTLTSDSRVDLRLVPPHDDRSGLLAVQPGAPAVGEAIAVAARVVNDGTEEPTADVTWTVDRIVRKGDPAQAGIAAPQSQRVLESGPQTIEVLSGVPVDLTLAIDPAQVEGGLPKGLYRVGLQVDPGHGPGKAASASVEFVVGKARPYYRVDFAEQDAAAGWMDVSPPSNGAGTGGSPGSIVFRQVGGRYLWGVSDAQDAVGATYCRPGDGMDWCNVSQDSNAPSPARGLHGIAQSPPINLMQVVNDNATLTLRHGFHFENPGDGARLEILPVNTPVTGSLPTPAYLCQGDGMPAMWFWVPAEDPSAQKGSILSVNPYVRQNSPNAPDMSSSIPGRINPINEKAIQVGATRDLREWPSAIPAFGGEGTDSQTVQFRLDQIPRPFCPAGSWPSASFNATPLQSLLNYTVQLRLNVGTLPGLTWACQSQPAKCRHNPAGGRPGDMGWQVDSISISSVDVAVTPETRSLPVFAGQPKRFSFLVTNLGQVEDTFTVSLDEAASAGLDGSWFRFMQPGTLAPGQTGTLSFGVDVPQGSAPGERRARLVVRSTMDPNVADTIDLDLRLEEKLLPDLTVQLAAVTASGREVEQGTVTQLSATVYNLGSKESEAVPIELHVTRDEVGSVLATRAVGRLCPYAVCGEQGSHQTLVFDWQVPEAPGSYTLVAKVDPKGKILEMSKAQNIAALQVNVTRLRRPDVAIADLSFEGLDPQGYALEGDLVTIVANVTNLGRAPASNVPVRIISGTAELVSVKLESLQPGESRLVTAARPVSRGEVPILAASAPSGQDVDPSNNELRRVLRVRGLDVQVEPPAQPILLRPGASGMGSVNVTNNGNVVERVLLRLDPAEKGWGLAVSPNPVTVAPGTTASALVTVVAPANAVSGARELALSAAPQSQAAAARTALLLVRVAVSEGDPEIRLGALGPDALAVRLVSHRNAAENLTLALAAPVSEAQPVKVFLQPFGNASINLPVALSPDVPPGPVRLTVQARDASGALRAETQGTVEVPRRVAGTVSWAGVVEPQAKDLSRRLIEYRVNVSNTGNVPFVPALRAVGLPDGFVQVGGGNLTAPVPPGRSAVAAVLLEASAELTSQVHGVLEVQARSPAATLQDISDGAVPGAGTVSIGRLTIPSLLLPDLEVVRVRIQPVGQVSVGDPVQFSVTVRNSGVVPSGPAELFAFVNGDLVNAYPTMPLAPGAEGVVNLTWAFTKRGEHLVHVVADGPDAVAELHPDNNGQSLVVEATQSQVSQLADRAAPGPGALPLAFAALALMAFLRRRGGRGGAG